MSVKFTRKCNFLGEACIFMGRYYQEETFEELQNHLKQRSGYSDEVDEILNVMAKVYEEIAKRVSFPEKLHIYFTSFDDDAIQPNLATCMLHAGIAVEDVPFEELIAYMKKQFHEDPTSFIEAILNSEQQPMDRDTFMKLLEETNMNDSAKWNILRVYMNFDEHLDILMDAILQVIPVMQEVYASYQKRFAIFCDFWEKAVADNRFYECLRISTKIDIHDDSDITVCPCWMGCNSVRLIAVHKDMKHMTMLLGLLFREKEFVNSTNLTREDILSRLKYMSDASKYEIMMLLKHDRLYGSQLAEKLHLSTATISHHMSALSSTALIDIEKDSNRVYYRLNKVQVSHLLDQLHKDLFED